jgi:hypothetical protein
LKLFRLRSGNGNTKLNAKLITFLTCLFLSMFFWFITTFSKDYTSTVIFPLTYINVPKNKVITNHLPATIDIEINASGFTILYYKLIYSAQTVKIDLKDLKLTKDQGVSFTAVNTKLEKISRQFGNRIRILRVVPDTLFVNYSKRISKTVPVRLKGTITYNKGYQLNDSIYTLPAGTIISGPEELVNKVKYIETEAVKFEDIDHTIKEDIGLIMPNDTSNFELANKQVQLVIPVVKITEETIELPIQVDNLPKKYTLKTFPDKVALRFSVPFNEFKRIDASSFRVHVDYSKRTNNRKLKLELVKKPANIKSFKMIPEKVEYIVRK